MKPIQPELSYWCSEQQTSVTLPKKCSFHAPRCEPRVHLHDERMARSRRALRSATGSSEVTVRPIIAESDMSKARERFSSGRRHVPDPDAAFTEAERIIIETATAAYPDIAADWPGLATEFLNTECPFEFDVMKSPAADPNKPVVACGRWTHRKYLLGPSESLAAELLSRLNQLQPRPCGRSLGRALMYSNKSQSHAVMPRS